MAHGELESSVNFVNVNCQILHYVAGEINNSKNFPEKFLPHVTKEVNKLVAEFIIK